MALPWPIYKVRSNYNDLDDQGKINFAKEWFYNNSNVDSDKKEEAFEKWKELNIDPDLQSLSEQASSYTEGLGDSAKELGKTGLQALANVYNTPTEIANIGRVGINAATGSNIKPIPNLIDLPEELTPQTEIGKATANILPMLIPSKATSTILTKGAGAIAKNAVRGAPEAVAARVVGEVTNGANTASRGAVATVKATSSNTEAPLIEDFIPEAERLITENPEKYEGKSVEDLALQLRDSEWAGRKAEQAVLGSTMRVGTTGNAVTRGTKLGAVGAGAEASKQATETALSGQDKFNADEIAGMGALGGVFGVGGKQLENIVSPGNKTRIEKIGKTIRKQEEVQSTVKSAEKDVANQDTLAKRFEPDQDIKVNEPPLGALRNEDGSVMITSSGDDVVQQAKTISSTELDDIRSTYFPNISDNEFYSMKPSEISKEISKSNNPISNLEKAQREYENLGSPLLDMAKVTERASTGVLGKLVPDVSVINKSTKEALGVGGVRNVISTAGREAESGLFAPNKIREINASKASDSIVNQATNDLQSFNNITDTSVLIKALRDNRDLTQSELKSAATTLADGSVTPLQIFNKARSEQKALKEFEGGGDNNYASALSAVAGYTTGGITTGVQAGASTLKQFADRPVINDLRRAAADFEGKASPFINDTLRSNITPQVAPVSKVGFIANTDRGEVYEAPSDDLVEVESFPFEVDSNDTSEIKDVEIFPWESNEAPQSNNTSEIKDVESFPWETNEAPQSNNTVADTLYNAFANAETGGESNPWIRTKGQDSSSNLHSSAYGPVQITYSLAQDYLNSKPDLFSDLEKEYLRAYVNQGKMMINASQGKIDDPKLQYGGEGYLTSQIAKDLYKSVAQKMLVDTYKNSGGSIAKTIQAWRGVDDPKYAKRIIDSLPA